VKRFRVIVLPSAEQDIGDAFEWISERDQAAAIKWYNRLSEVIDSLELLPLRCPLPPESQFFKDEIRETFHGRRHHRYRILFTISGNTVYVLHIRHGARLWLGESGPVDS
jgi:plasmid stabilization system protein ParE